MTEFEIIRDCFGRLTGARDDVILGIGDDAALIAVPPGLQLAVSTDTLVSGVHFLADTAPRDIGFKSLAVNLSDLAAMAAEPRWATLALTVPNADADWLREFAAGFAELAKQFYVALIGGDMSRGPLSITIQIMGVVPPGVALRRSGAGQGDRIYVTGNLGGAGLALHRLLNRLPGNNAPLDDCMQRLLRPTPRIAAGLALRGAASAAIDVSDGLFGDLGHVCEASGVGARIELGRLPINPAVQQQCDTQAASDLALTAGDDYELCFTVPPDKAGLLDTLFAGPGLRVTQVGEIVSGSGVRCVKQDGSEYVPGSSAYRHF